MNTADYNQSGIWLDQMQEDLPALIQVDIRHSRRRVLESHHT